MCTNSIGAGVELSSNQVFESLWICMLLQVTAAKVDLTVPGWGGDREGLTLLSVITFKEIICTQPHLLTDSFS